MANSEHHGVKGDMWLKRSWTESSSGHVETYDDLKLESTEDGKNVILVKTYGSKNFLKIAGSTLKEERYQISADDLANLIKNNGVRV
jgi:hypothetical protein